MLRKNLVLSLDKVSVNLKLKGFEIWQNEGSGFMKITMWHLVSHTKSWIKLFCCLICNMNISFRVSMRPFPTYHAIWFITKNLFRKPTQANVFNCILNSVSPSQSRRRFHVNSCNLKFNLTLYANANNRICK